MYIVDASYFSFRKICSYSMYMYIFTLKNLTHLGGTPARSIHVVVSQNSPKICAGFRAAFIGSAIPFLLFNALTLNSTKRIKESLSKTVCLTNHYIEPKLIVTAFSIGIYLYKESRFNPTRHLCLFDLCKLSVLLSYALLFGLRRYIQALSFTNTILPAPHYIGRPYPGNLR